MTQVKHAERVTFRVTFRVAFRMVSTREWPRISWGCGMRGDPAGRGGPPGQQDGVSG